MTTVITCVYCGHAYEEGTPSHAAEVLKEHINQCEKHPIKKALEDRAKLRAALVKLVGLDNPRELEEMKGVIKAFMSMTNTPHPEQEGILSAIQTLIDVRD